MDAGPASRRRWLPLPDFGPLQTPDFRRILVARTVTDLGSALTMVALPFQVYELTSSTLAVGLLGAVELPSLLLAGVVGGLLADGRDRRRILLVTEAGLLLISLALAGNALLRRPSLVVVYVAAALAALVLGLQRPSLDAVIPRLVGRDELSAAAALASIPHNVAEVAGPAVAGVLLAAAGVPIAFGLDALSFAVSLLILAGLRQVPAATRGLLSRRAALEGLRYARHRRDLLGTYLVDLNAMIFGMPLALFPALSEQFGGPEVLGLMYAAPAIGSLLAATTSRWVTPVSRQGQGLILAAGTYGLAVAGAGLVERLGLVLAFLGIAGFADMVSGIFRTTIWNASVPDELRGRMAGIELVSYSTGPALGNLEAGLVAGFAGVRVSVVSGGLLCVAGTGVLAALLPALRRYRHPT